MSHKCATSEVPYEFELAEDITIPANCVLEFDGGSVSAGSGDNMSTVTGINTAVSVKGNYNPFTGIVQAGTWSHINPSDKPYASDNGMGKVYLKKGMPLSLQMTKANTIYVIQYDFTLGEDITIPANCVLDFDGGSISGNGTGKDTITGNNTGIDAGVVKIFNTNITLAGTWNIAEAYPEWFGAIKNDSSADNSSAINKCFIISNKVKLGVGTYYVGASIILPPACILEGVGFGFTKGTAVRPNTTNIDIIVITSQFYGGNEVRDLTIYGDSNIEYRTCKGIVSTYAVACKITNVSMCELSVGIDFTNCPSCCLDHVHIWGCSTYAAAIQGQSYNTKILGCNFNSSPVGLYVRHSHVFMYGTDFEDFGICAIELFKGQGEETRVTGYGLHIEDSRETVDASDHAIVKIGENCFFSLSGSTIELPYASRVMFLPVNLAGGSWIRLYDNFIYAVDAATSFPNNIAWAKIFIMMNILNGTGTLYRNAFTSNEQIGSIAYRYETSMNAPVYVAENIKDVGFPQ